MPAVSLIGLVSEDIMVDAQHEIQRQLNQSDGELVQIKAQEFVGINFLTPSIEAQGLLQVFAEVGCVYSAFRLSYSLYQANDDIWPVVSDELSFYYAMLAMEGRISLKYDHRVAFDLIQFEFSREFRRYRKVLTSLIEQYAPARSICPEIIEHMRRLNRLH